MYNKANLFVLKNYCECTMGKYSGLWGNQGGNYPCMVNPDSITF